MTSPAADGPARILPSPVPAPERLLAALRQGPATRAELAQRAQIAPRYAHELLLGMLAHGQARRTRPAPGGPYVWEAAPHGQH